MHILRAELKSLDETAEAVDLDQSRADIVVLSFTDSDLAVVAKAWETLCAESAGLTDGLSLRLASLGDLKHPFSVDLYAEKVIAHARFVFVRLLGGLDYWRYGAEEVARLARASGATLAFVPGDHREDLRLDALSTAPFDEIRRLWRWMQAGGEHNAEQGLKYVISKLGRACSFEEPREQAAFGEFDAARRRAGPDASRALLVFYRAAWLAGDTAPYEALADSLAARGFEVRAVFATSLKDPEAASALRALLTGYRPDLVLNATSFSARSEDGSTPFDACNAPVFQVGVSLATLAQWQAATRGLSPSDLAMNVALPEVDGRVFAGAISFKAETTRIDSLEYAPLRSEPHGDNVDFTARLAAAWAALRRETNARKRLAFVLSDYPAKGGRDGYAVGLDTFASMTEIALRLDAEGYDVGDLAVADLPRRVALRAGTGVTLARYCDGLAALSPSFVASLRARWGAPESDPDFVDGRFAFRFARFGAAVVALQPDRGSRDHRKQEYHDTTLPPRHGYVAFYLWLREIEQVHAIVHYGAHGTLEWLSGKAVALSRDCAPRAVLGPVPLIYPFIVSNPGEATQAKRRAAAVILGHLTPPLIAADAHGVVAELEGLLDEYSQAQTLDPRRARRIAELILDRAKATEMAGEAGIDAAADLDDALIRLDAWLCDIKDMRIGDGLHVFGRGLDAERSEAAVRSIAQTAPQESARVADLVARSAPAELEGLVRALSGRRVDPGPGGAPARGRLDVLPTGRNLYSVDPRAIPTRTAWELGARAAEEFLARYLQDHGDWPRRVVFDLWGSAAMRTGGEDLAQAMALLGTRPVWDTASHRVSGFEVLALATLGRPRVDVTLRISGLFRDVFPAQIALFQAAVAAVSERREETLQDNPLAEAVRGGGSAARIFGAAPGVYGVGLARRALTGNWDNRDELGAEYLAATSHAYGGDERPAAQDFADRVAQSQALVHVQDLPGQDVLDSDAFADHEGGFAAAAAALGATPSIYHLDVTDPKAPRARSLQQEIARALRGRAANPRWIRGQMRHGYRGAAEIAESVDNLFVFAATTDLVSDSLFDILFEAVCADKEVCDFLRQANPAAASAIATRFDEALRRGLWRSRRNSVAEVLDHLREAA